MVQSMNFKSGSSAIALDQENRIKTIAAQAGGNAFFLVVGYAPKTGDPSGQPRTLSQARDPCRLSGKTP